MQLTRELRVRLSETADDYALKTANSWSGWPDVDRIVPFLVVRATVDGTVNKKTGYVCDVKTIDLALRGAVAACVAEGPQRSYEAFTDQLWRALTSNQELPAQLVAMEIDYSPYLRLRKTREASRMTTITQQYEFSAAHRLHCRELSDHENQTLFGKCNNANGHGHNYILDVVLQCEPTAAGRALGLAEMDQTVRRLVIDRFDHKHLNDDTEEFRNLNPTVENIASIVFGLLENQFLPARLAAVRLYETAKTWVEVSVSDGHPQATGSELSS